MSRPHRQVLFVGLCMLDDICDDDEFGWVTLISNSGTEGRLSQLCSSAAGPELACRVPPNSSSSW